MKLYYAPYACSLSPHIVLRELGLPFELVKVNNQTKETADGRDFLTINPKGYVAALELDDGQVLTEGPVIVQYLADLQPEKELAPPVGTWGRTRLQEWLNFLTSEIHAGAAPLFRSAVIPKEAIDYFRERLFKRFDYLEGVLAEQPYLLGNAFSVADAYLFTLLGWSTFLSFDLDRWSALPAHVKRVGERPSVQVALQAEAEA
ncbi:glutathione transferase GstA [Dyella caseinilytica]|uniref:Glutathione transferase GstA n=1 Tax=Dyella caseinilytica TaxID=1849581 RepID=A0ABX7GSZ7_9GAMM|nr:glutathione transferase GstA [Dyella caseinilytica]QRN53584.1 glutathione transferase GstA [Dyella caseinilytica]GFZ87668.1 glutathione S-transferase [Dyella caseinilytica]